MFRRNSRADGCRALPGRSTQIPDRAGQHFVLGRRSRPLSDGLETAMFGLGCFWVPSASSGRGARAFKSMRWATAQQPNPTYEEGRSGRTGHNDVVLVVYDPKKISYEQLLNTFGESHDPTRGCARATTPGSKYS